MLRSTWRASTLPPTHVTATQLGLGRGGRVEERQASRRSRCRRRGSAGVRSVRASTRGSHRAMCEQSRGRDDLVRQDEHVLAGEGRHVRRAAGRAVARPAHVAPPARNELSPERRRRDRLAWPGAGAPDGRPVRVERVEDDCRGHREVARPERVGRRLEAAHHPGVAAAPDEQPDRLAGLADRGGGEPERLVERRRARPVDTDRHRAGSGRPTSHGRSRPFAAEPVAASARSGRGRAFWSRSCVRAERSSLGRDDVQHHLHARADALDEVRLGDEVALRREVDRETLLGGARRDRADGDDLEGEERGENERHGQRGHAPIAGARIERPSRRCGSGRSRERGRRRSRGARPAGSCATSAAVPSPSRARRSGVDASVPARARGARRPLATGAQAAGPRRAGRVDLVRGGWPNRISSARGATIARRSAAHAPSWSSRGRSRPSRSSIETIAVDDAARREQRRDPRRRWRRVVEREGAAEQRAPREEDRQLVGDAGTAPSGDALRGRDDEQRVRQARPARGGATDSAIAAALASIADDEGAGLRAGPAEDRPTVAGPEVDDDPVGASDPVLRVSRRPPR